MSRRILSSEEIRSNYHTIIKHEKKLKILARSYSSPGDDIDTVFGNACDKFTLYFDVLNPSEAQVMYVFRGFVLNEYEKIWRTKKREIGVDNDKYNSYPAPQQQSIKGAIQDVLAFCRRSGKEDLAKAIWAIVRGETCCEAAQTVGLTSVQLHRQLRAAGRALAGGA